MPSVIYDSETEDVKKMLKRAKELGATEALVGNVGHLAIVKEAGLVPHADYR